MNYKFIDPETIKILSESTLFSIIEFFTIAFIVIATYLAIKGWASHLKPATQMLVSMFIGSLAYTLGKLVLITAFVTPYVDNFYISPF